MRASLESILRDVRPPKRDLAWYRSKHAEILLELSHFESRCLLKVEEDVDGKGMRDITKEWVQMRKRDLANLRRGVTDQE